MGNILPVKTSWGVFTLHFSTRGLFAVQFPKKKKNQKIKKIRLTDAVQKEAVKLLQDYFRGRRIDLTSVPMDLSAYSLFERRVLKALSKIPYGCLVSYQQLARKALSPRASRAIGNVMNKNRLPLFLPCHRVIRSDGGWGGYGPGLSWKKRLLRLEGQYKTPFAT